MKLSKKQIIQYCDETIARINNNDSTYFLCPYLKEYIKAKTFWGRLFGVNKDLSKYIPEFTYENAAKHANASIRNHNNPYDKIWWSFRDNDFKYTKDRILFLEWIKSQYTTPEK